MTTLEREPIQIVEIDIGYCGLTYGNAPCTAALGSTGVRKCYNTFFTCQDEENYDSTTLTLRFAQNQTGLPSQPLIYPCMRSPVSTNPTRINLGGVGKRIGSLGKRARVQVQLQDFPDSDIYTDKYQSERVDGTAQTDEGGYNPSDRGTFFGKLRRRWPYYVGRPLRVLEGYEGDSLASMRTRHYVITEWRGPDINGRVGITAQDILDLADDEKAQAPIPGRGRLGVDIDAGTLPSFDLLPETVGSEYSSSGFASIGSEVVSFTRSGDTITITGRAEKGTDGSAHSADDLFQECYVVEDQSIASVAEDLLVNYADVDASFIPTSDWQDEAERWLAGFDLTATIAKPVGVAQLLGELAELGVYWWWDDIAQEIKMRANRPIDLDESLSELSDAKTVIEGSLSSTDLYDKRLTRVLFWHGQLDPTEDVEEKSNYRRLYIAINEDSEQSDSYNEKRTYEIFSRWLGAGNNSVASAVSNRLKNRYADTPREVTFDADVKDESDTRLASLISLTTRALQDETGNSLPTQMQVSGVEEIDPGHVVRVTAQSFAFVNRYGFITENSRSDYTASTDAEQEKGTYIADGDPPLLSNGDPPYVIF